MRKAESIDNVKTAKGILDALGIPFCLFLGSALGAWRDEDFCPGDEDDLDLAVHIDHYAHKQQIIEEFERFGFETKQYEAPFAVSPQLAFQRMHTDPDGGKWHTKVDIFFLVPRSNTMIWTFYTADGAQNRAVKSEYFLYPNNIEFFGQHCNVPGFTTEYLIDNYGPGWRTPIHRDYWNWSRDNQCVIV